MLGIVCMVIGYRAADGAFFWGRTPAMTTGINNLLVSCWRSTYLPPLAKAPA